MEITGTLEIKFRFLYIQLRFLGIVFQFQREEEDLGSCSPLSPHVDDLADHHAGQGRLALPQLVQEQLEVTHHRHGSLPALLHPCGLGDLI